MIIRALVTIAFLVPQIAFAADVPQPTRHHRVHHRIAHISEPDRVINCTNSKLFGFLSYSDCGQGFDPLATGVN